MFPSILGQELFPNIYINLSGWIEYRIRDKFLFFMGLKVLYENPAIGCWNGHIWVFSELWKSLILKLFVANPNLDLVHFWPYYISSIPAKCTVVVVVDWVFSGISYFFLILGEFFRVSILRQIFCSYFGHYAVHHLGIVDVSVFFRFW